jgi:ABC-type transporter Mla MlaB component
MLTDTPCQIAINSGEDRSLTLVLRGDLTIYQAGQLYETALALLEHEADVMVSCREVVQLDTAILQILLVLQRELQSRSRSLRFSDVSREVRGLLELAGVNDTLTGQAATQSTWRGRKYEEPI